HVILQIGAPGTAEQARCVGDCMRAHEDTHVQQIMAVSPKVCKAKASGVLVGPTDVNRLKTTEIAASTVEIECLKRKQEAGCSCKQIIDRRIQQMEAYRESFRDH